jgi:accessory gene regulator B
LIESIAERIAIRLKEANPRETTSIAVMRYALIGIIHNTITFTTAFIIGLLLGHLFDTFIVAISFMGLRLVSGGYHFRTPLSCLIFSTLIFVSIPFISLQSEAYIIINSISLLLTLIFAPSNIKEHVRVSEKYFPIFKLISVVIVVTNYLFLNPVITLSIFAQSITLIYLPRKGGQYEK